MRDKTSSYKLAQTLVFAATALCLCGCATTDEQGNPTYWGEMLEGAKNTCTVIAGYVVSNPEQSASVLEWIGGTLSVCGAGGVGAVFIWGANKLRKACGKKASVAATEDKKEPESTECAKDTLSA